MSAICSENWLVSAYRITSISSQHIHEGRLNSSQIDVSQLSPGLYVVELVTDEGSRAVTRFVKE